MINNREELIKHLTTDENRYIGIRLMDKIESVLKHHSVGYTDFLDPYQISFCTPILKQFNNIGYRIDGGIKEAERQVITIYPDYMYSKDIASPLRAIKIIGDFTNKDLSHRDFLGSILGLGLRREKIGDIYIENGYGYLIAFEELCNYIKYHLLKISKYGVEVHDASLEEVKGTEERFELIHSTIPSLRLDAIVSIGFGESRNCIAKRINNDKVKVNWKPVNNGAYLLYEGDIISFKGLGRIQLFKINGTTKKDRIKITIKRFL